MFFATRRGAYGSKASDAIIGRWYHIAMVRVDYTLYGFVDGKRTVSFPCYNISLRNSNIDFNRQRDGSNRASFVIDNFRIRGQSMIRTGVYGFADHRLNQLIQPTVSRIYNFVFDQTTSLTKFLLN